MQQLADSLAHQESERVQRPVLSQNSFRKPALTRHGAAAEQCFRLVFDTITCGVMIWNTVDHLVEANEAALRILDVNRTSMQQYLLASNRPAFTRPDGSPLPHEEQLIPLAFRTGQAQQNVLQGYIRPDGQQHWLQLDALPLYGEHGETTRVIVTLVDVTDSIQAMKRIQAEEERFRILFEHISDLISVLDEDGTIRYASPFYRQGYGYTPDELRGRNTLDLITPEDRSLVSTQLQGCGQQAGVNSLQTCNIHIAGSARIFESIVNNQLDNPTIHGIIISSRDITERVQAEEALHEREQLFRALTEQSNDLTEIFDAAGHFRYASPSHRQILGYAPEDLVGKNVFPLFHLDDLPRMRAALEACLEVSGALVRVECRLRRADGSWLTMDGVAHNCLDNPAVNGVVVTARDITEQIALERALRHRAQHDSLTGLPNSTHFIDVLEQAILAAGDEQKSMALLVLDIDRFKDINDTFGHQRGDLLLQQVAIRLQQLVPAPDLVSRLSGDEFAILLRAADATRTRTMASAIQHALEEPCLVDGYPVQIDATIGCSLYPAHATDGPSLLRRADMAMYAAKHTHENYALFDAALEQYNPRRLALTTELRRAITANELTLYYQPKVELSSREICGVEALVRWQHPSSGLIPPDQFIPLAEQTGLIGPLTHWVLEEAVRQCGEWLRAGHKLSVAVNISAWNLRDITLPETVAELLERYQVPARLLSIELTESAMMIDPDRSLEVLAQLFSLGVCLSIDDYGTGYSSLAYLKRLPVDELKIDRSFVQHMTTDRADATIVRSTVNLAHTFGLRVVAEGVEDEDTLHLLTTLHCDLAQGYYLSRPVPPEELERWLHEERDPVYNREGQ